MKFVFRVDASSRIGTGHVMRCLTLADALRDRQADVLFISRQLTGDLREFIGGKGFNVITLPEDSSDNAFDWREDADRTAKALQNEGAGFSWLIVDHYGIDQRWEKVLRPHVDRIMVIDDLADRSHDCDLLLDQNQIRSIGRRYADLVPEHCRTLVGTRYALLRSEFLRERNRLSGRSGAIDRVLVFFGGSDLCGQTEKALKSLQRWIGAIQVDVVVGSSDLHREEIRMRCEDLPGVTFHCQTDDMAGLMARSDLSIGAGGTVTWERCCLGLPAIVLSVAPNQDELSSELAENGAILFLGQADNVDASTMADALATLKKSPALVRSLSRKSAGFVDGFGTERVVRELMPPPITLRTADMGDCRDIHAWRNADETRRHIFNTEPIPFDKHRMWFEKSLANPDRVLLIGEIDKKPVGVLRYDCRDDGEALISIFLVPGGQGGGVGTQLIREGSRWLENNRPSVKRVRAEVLTRNVPSMKAFRNAGYEDLFMTFEEILH